MLGSIVSGFISAKASKDAAETQLAASREAIEMEERQYNQTRSDLKPWREAGANALAQLEVLTGPEGALMAPFDASSLTEDPGYQFGLSEGEKSINRSMASRGMLNSGAALKALQRFGQDYAGTKFNEAFNRDQISKNQAYNMLAGLSGSGQTATTQTAAFGANAANNMANYTMQGANAKAAGTVGAANAITGAIDDVTGYYRMMNLLRGG